MYSGCIASNDLVEHCNSTRVSLQFLKSTMLQRQKRFDCMCQGKSMDILTVIDHTARPPCYKIS